MEQRQIWIIILALIIVLLGWFFFQQTAVNGPEEGDTTTEEQESEGGVEVTENDDESLPSGGDDVTEGSQESVDAGTGAAIITYTESGFSPATLEVAAGTIVTFRNESSQDVWPASAIHPTHRVYPGSDIAKCGTVDVLTVFDACGGVDPGASYSFRFDETGTWGYHNHLSVAETGRIIVQ